MQNIINLTEKTNIVIHSLAFIAANSRIKNLSAKTIATELKVSETYLSKVLQSLVKDEILESSRGTKGGYSLKKSAKNINLLEIVESLETEIPDNHCLYEKKICNNGKCPFQKLSSKMRRIFIKELQHKTIADVAKSFKKREILF